MTRARRVDRNHGEIRDGLRWAGFDTFDCSRFGDGFPDLLVRGPDERLVLMEVKMPGEKLTVAERVFGLRFAVHVVHSIEEALACLT